MEEDRISEDILKVLRIIWKINMPPKWKVFMWRIMYNGLAVNYNLRRRGIEVDSQCGYCGYVDESIQFVFRTRSVARLAWIVYKIQVQIESIKPISFATWVKKNILLFYSEDESDNNKIEGFVGMLWSLWVTRNFRLFRNIGVMQGLCQIKLRMP